MITAETPIGKTRTHEQHNRTPIPIATNSTFQDPARQNHNSANENRSQSNDPKNLSATSKESLRKRQSPNQNSTKPKNANANYLNPQGSNWTQPNSKKTNRSRS